MKLYLISNKMLKVERGENFKKQFHTENLTFISDTDNLTLDSF